MMDHGYLNLVAHLSTTKSSLPLTTIHASIAHYLAHVQPSPTQLAASVVSSPLSSPLVFPILDGLLAAFRHAVYLKIKVVTDGGSGLFSRGLSTRIAEWTIQILKGLQGSHSALRLTCCAGLLFGINDHERELQMKEGYAHRRVEEELVISLAEIIDIASPAAGAWEVEFRSNDDRGTSVAMLRLRATLTVRVDFFPNALVIASRVLPLIAPDRLKALPLTTFSRIIQHAILDAFRRGDFPFDSFGFSSTSEAGKLTISVSIALYGLID